jgi:hypothetical protein
MVDVALAREYARAFRELAEALQVPADISWAQVATQPGVMKLE